MLQAAFSRKKQKMFRKKIVYQEHWQKHNLMRAVKYASTFLILI
jgi:hypothetical protein